MVMVMGHYLWIFRIIAASLFLHSLHAQTLEYPTANLSTLWTNDQSLPHNVTFPEGSMVRAILLRRNPGFYGPSFAAGFFCNSACDAFLFSVFIVYANSGGGITNPTTGGPQVVWSANRDHPVREKATLQFTKDGDLALRDFDGTLVWSTNTSGKSVVAMNITESGNLVLFDRNNASIWQSFDHPTDSLVPGQSMREGMRLTPNISTTNWTQGQLYLSVHADGLYGFVDTSPPQLYVYYGNGVRKPENNSTNLTFGNGSLTLFSKPGEPDELISLPSARSVQYMRLESDGHLRLYEYNMLGQDQGWQMVKDVFSSNLDYCAYPTACGEYGICTAGQCSCPPGKNFRQLDDRLVRFGCAPVTPISCQAIQDHQLLTLSDVSYFSYMGIEADYKSISGESCKQACLKNCSCKAALFQYWGGNSSDGYCYLPSQLFSLQTNQPAKTHFNSSAYIKVQVNSSSPNPKTNSRTGIIIGVTSGITAIILIAIIFFGRRQCLQVDEEEHFDQVPGMPTRFTFEELKEATENFSKKLGEGGFGTVFEGKIGDERVAVKRLENFNQGEKQFSAEVETIGSIHHINLVRLIGFCAGKTHRLLVYEYMCNGSLDKWIFYRDQIVPLDWQTRCKIITDIAKGLAYLHEECRQRIAHLDIKPHNILLDDKFNAKVADFGLAKLIDRDQSQVMTRMRGTPGYLAPEWLTSIITEKVDIYSFGVVVLEIICGRKNLDYSQPSENIHLINLLQEKMKVDQLLDIADSHINDMKSHGEEVIQMMKLAIWCLQNDSSKRPLMSMVVKVLEGGMSVDTCLEYNFVNDTSVTPSKVPPYSSYLPSASVLSGPR
ncbi:G-type lectin S-receptor-like serine/threonine-protein kinase SD2-5 [Typha angustifolia]|uniref:G-type lectin S-receptor-like serine/threonine-protein kinase SD2-5 n=1 Tax=Typha angustifolia TaxID=59011 RepID=UPI003C2C76D6